MRAKVSEVALLVVALAAAAAAQERADEKRITAWIEQLDDPDALQRDTAMHRLAAVGRPAALALMRKLRQLDSIHPGYVRTLGRMGPDAVDGLEMLFEGFEEAQETEPLSGHIYVAIAGVLPFVQDSDHTPVMRAQDALIATQRALVAKKQDLDASDLEWALLLVRVAQQRYQLLVDRSDVDELVLHLGGGDASGLMRGQIPARLLGRTGSRGFAALRGLHAYLRFGQWERSELIVPFAEAILAIDPASDEAIGAHVYLSVHGDAYQQQVAAVALRQFGEKAAGSVELLLPALRDESLHPRNLAELITTVGIIGPYADRSSIVGVMDELKKLSSHADPQIAERAKAALRQIAR